MTTTDAPRMVPGTPFFCSWSGGKDCCLALELSAEAGTGRAAINQAFLGVRLERP